jgi:cyanophycinase
MSSSRNCVTACILFGLFLASAVGIAASDYDHSPTVGPARGHLVIVGGGQIVPAIRDRFVKLAGGPDANFVMIPTAAPDAMINDGAAGKYFSTTFNVTHVTVLHTRDRKLADSPAFVKPLQQASGVWIEGGRQWRLADAYLGTAVEREIKALLARWWSRGRQFRRRNHSGGIPGPGCAGCSRQPRWRQHDHDGARA